GERGLKNGPSVSGGVGSSSSPHSGVGARPCPGRGPALLDAAPRRTSGQRSRVPTPNTTGATTRILKNRRRLSSRGSLMGGDDSSLTPRALLQFRVNS